MTQLKKIAYCSVVLLVLMALLSLIFYGMRNRDTSDALWALIAAVYFILFPCIEGVTLKVILNGKRLALLILSVCTLLWAVGSAVLFKEKFFWELLLRLIIIPIIMLFYFFTHLVVKSEKKRAPIAIMTAMTMLAAFIVWLGTLFFLSLLGWG